MITLLPNLACPVCGRRHNFATADGQVKPGQTAAYCCPERGTFGTIDTPSQGEPVRHFPQGAVPLTRPVRRAA